MSTKLVTEMLAEINENPATITKYKDNGALRLIFEHAFDPEKKFFLPEGDPPFKEDAAPIGMSPANLHMEARKLYVFCRADLNKLRRESLFIQLLEGLHPFEAKLILAIKDQKLPKMYPKITQKLVSETFSSVPAPAVKEKKVKNSQAPASGATA